MQSRIHAGADRGHGLRLGEDFGVRSDADFEVLAPHAARDQRVLERGCFARAGPQRLKVVADDVHDVLADSFRRLRIAAGALLDHPLDHRDGEGHARRLDRLEVDGSEQPRLRGVAFIRRRVGENVFERAEPSARRRA